MARLALFLLSLAVIATTMTIGIGDINQVWAEVIEGTEGDDVIVGTPGDDVIVSGEGDDSNDGDTEFGDGSGDDVIVSGEGGDFNAGSGGADTFVCGGGEDTVTDYNEEEGDIAAPDCENV